MMRVPVGQFVHGASLRTLGIAEVTVPPEHRAKGCGRVLMQQVLRAAFDEGFVLSSLYPSTQTLYRSADYEQCGAMFEHRVGRGELYGFRAGEFEVRALSTEAPEVRALYKTFAARTNGYLDRGDYVWWRVARHRGSVFECLGCFRRDQMPHIKRGLYLDVEGRTRRAKLHQRLGPSPQSRQRRRARVVDQSDHRERVERRVGGHELVELGARLVELAAVREQRRQRRGPFRRSKSTAGHHRRSARRIIRVRRGERARCERRPRQRRRHGVQRLDDLRVRSCLLHALRASARERARRTAAMRLRSATDACRARRSSLPRSRWTSVAQASVKTAAIR